MKKATIAIAILSLAGCNKLKLETPPVPPSWDAQCQPDDSAYIDMAKDTQDRPPALEPGTTPAQAQADVLAWLGSMGYEITVGRPPGYAAVTDEDQNFCGVTLPGHVYVSKECVAKMDKDETDLAWAVFLRHESTHAHQQVRMGLLFFGIYAYGEGRLLGIETPAYDEGYDSYAFFVSDQPELELKAVSVEAMQERAASVFGKYSGAHMPQKCFEEIAVEIWSTR